VHPVFAAIFVATLVAFVILVFVFIHVRKWLYYNRDAQHVIHHTALGEGRSEGPAHSVELKSAPADVTQQYYRAPKRQNRVSPARRARSPSPPQNSPDSANNDRLSEIASSDERCARQGLISASKHAYRAIQLPMRAAAAIGDARRVMSGEGGKRKWELHSVV
jgi:hypothetical protein